MNSFQLEQWQSELLNIFLQQVFDSSAEGVVIGNNPQSIQDIVDAAILTGDLFSTAPSGFDVSLYVSNILSVSRPLLDTLGQDGPLPIRVAGPYDLYNLILDIISFRSEGDDATSSLLADRELGSYVLPAEGVDPFTWLFLNGARETNLAANQINAGANFLGRFGELYNNTQFALRFGDAPQEEVVSQASNSIIQAIATTILNNSEDAGTPGFPTLFQLGQQDGQVGASALWTQFDNGFGGEGFNGFGSDIGGWAGTPFFALLGAPQFLQRDLLYYSGPSENEQNAAGANPVFSPAEFGSLEDENSTTYNVLALFRAFADSGLQALSEIEGNASFTTASEFFTAVGEAIDQLNGASSSIPTTVVEFFSSLEPNRKLIE